MSRGTGEISYSTVLARVKMELGIANTTDHDPYLILKADEAMRQINDLFMYELKTVNVPLDSGTAEVPCGLIRVMGLWFTNADGTRCTAAPYVHRDIVDHCDCDTSACPVLLNTFQINGNHIVFSNPSAMTADEVSVAFLGMRLDENNQPYIAETHDRCVQSYLKWRYRAMMCSQVDNAAKGQMMYQQSMSDAQDFKNQKKYLQGLANVTMWEENKRNIGRKFNAWTGRVPRGV